MMLYELIVVITRLKDSSGLVPKKIVIPVYFGYQVELFSRLLDEFPQNRWLRGCVVETGPSDRIYVRWGKRY